jgi:hypothetical protein
LVNLCVSTYTYDLYASLFDAWFPFLLLSYLPSFLSLLSSAFFLSLLVSLNKLLHLNAVHAVVRKLVAVFPRRRLDSRSSHVGLVVEKWYWTDYLGALLFSWQFSLHQFLCTHRRHDPRLVKRSQNGLRTEWTQSHPIPRIKKKANLRILLVGL